MLRGCIGLFVLYFALIAQAQGLSDIERVLAQAQNLDDLKDAAWLGDAGAQYALGLVYANGIGVPRDDKEGVAWIREAAERGHALAQSSLGLRYSSGKGVPQDYKEAAVWWHRAAEQGNAEAQYNLGVLYEDGVGVPQDYKEAIVWYRKAAEKGYAEAQNNLGIMYALGQGVPKSNVIAYALSNLAAAQATSSDGSGIKLRSLVAKKMTVQEIEAAQALSRKMNVPGNFFKAMDQYVAKPAGRAR